MLSSISPRGASEYQPCLRARQHLNKNAARADADGDAPAGGGLTLKQAEEALGVFVGEGWLSRSKYACVCI